MLCGIPQGSTLGLLLFLMYINDLPNCSEKLCIKIFADDTNVFASARDLKSLEHLMNSELAKVRIKGSCEQLMDECYLVPLFKNEFSWKPMIWK